MGQFPLEWSGATGAVSDSQWVVAVLTVVTLVLLMKFLCSPDWPASLAYRGSTPNVWKKTLDAQSVRPFAVIDTIARYPDEFGKTLRAIRLARI